MGIAWLGKKAFSMENRWQTKGLKLSGDFSGRVSLIGGCDFFKI